MIKESIDMYRLTDLKRYNNSPKIHNETLAEHQYFCAIILMSMKKYLKIAESDFNNLLQYLLIHDVGELYTGDIPHNVKEDFPIVRKILDETEYNFLVESGFDMSIVEIDNDPKLHHLFKLIDSLQVKQYVKNEISLGNNSKRIHQIDEESLQCICMRYEHVKELFTEEFDINKMIESL